MFHFLSKIIISVVVTVGGVFGLHNSKIAPTSSPVIFNKPAQTIIITPSITPKVSTKKVYIEKTKPSISTLPNPTVDNSAALQAQQQAEQAKIAQEQAEAQRQAELKAQADQQAQQAFQKLQQEIQQQAAVQAAAQQQKTNQINSLTATYNAQYNALEQQIVDIKTQYYKDVDALNNQAGNTEFTYSRELGKLTDDANLQIQKIQLQEQQLYLNYQTQINALK